MSIIAAKIPLEYYFQNITDGQLVMQSNQLVLVSSVALFIINSSYVMFSCTQDYVDILQT